MFLKLKRAFITVMGVLFLITGIIGLALPFLQGFLFIFIGVILLSLVSKRIRGWVEIHTRTHPQLHKLVQRVERWVERLIGSTHTSKESGRLPKGYFYHQEGYIYHSFPVEKFASLPKSIETEGNILFKKDEFHVTVVHIAGIAKQLANGSEKNAEEFEQGILTLLTEHESISPITFDHFKNDLRLASKDDRMSIVARCEMHNLAEFFARIEKEYGQAFPVQPAHVTLYTRTKGKAIGIDSDEQIESYKKLSLPELEHMLSSIELKGL